MSFRQSAGAAVAMLLMLALLTAELPGQVIVQQMRNDIPIVRRIDPPILRPGTTVELTLTGERLGGLKQLVSDGKLEVLKVTVAKGKTAKVTISVGSDVKPGTYSVYALCDAGLSNPRLVRVDRLPYFREKEPNNSVAKATTLTLPAGVAGILPANDIDFFAFEVRAGQRIAFDLEAHRLGSAIRPVLSIADDRGREIRRTWIPRGSSPDVLLVHRFRRAGRFFVRIAERTFQGNANRCYYLRMGELKIARSMFPLGGRRGTTVKVTLEGGSLLAPLTHETTIAKDFPTTRRQLFFADPTGLIAAPFLFAIDDLPETNEREGNDTRQKAQELSLPIIVNGRLDRPGDRDFFRFPSVAGQRVQIRVSAQELGSPIDPFITIQTAKGRVVARGDDFNSADRIPPFVRAANTQTQSDDVRLSFRPPANGNYTVAVNDRYQSGGKHCGYRLRIDRSPADFELVAQPGQVTTQRRGGRRRRTAVRTLAQYDGQGTGVLSIDRGGQGTVVVKVNRRGYNGAIRIEAKNVPPGVTVRELVIPAGQKQGSLRFFAGFDAEMNGALVEIFGTASVSGRTIRRRAEHPVVFSGMPLGVVAQRSLAHLAIGVSNRGAELAMRAKLLTPLAPGGRSRLHFEVRRRKGIVGPVTVKPIAIPTGLVVPSITIPANSNIQVVDVLAGVKTAPGLRTLQFQAELKVKKRKQPLQAQALLEVRLTPLVALSLPKNRLDIRRGQTLPVRIQVAAPKLAGKGIIELKTSRLPRGVKVAPRRLAMDARKKQLSIQFVAAKNARVSPIRRIVRLQPTLVIGKQRISLPTLRIALRVQR